MLHRLSDIEVKANFECWLTERGKIVPRSRREVHNVFTNVGRAWLAHLIAWNALGDPDTADTERRVRWISLGVGSQPEFPTVSSMVNATAVDDAGNYLAPIQSVEFPTPTPPWVAITKFIRTFAYTEISLLTAPLVKITEAALFADVYRVDVIGGANDSAFAPGKHTTLNPKSKTNAPVCYAAFEEITKSQDFALEARWDYRF